MALLPAMLAGCLGDIPTDDAQADPAPPSSAGAPARPDGLAAASVGHSPARLWLLSPEQYENVVEQALGTEVDLTGIAVTERHESFLNPASGGMAAGDVFFATLEESVARISAEQAPILAKRLGCPLAMLDRPCLQAFLEPFARVLFRTPRPDVLPFLDLHAALAPAVGPERAFQGVLTAVLLSPKTLFRVELGEAPAAVTGTVPLSAPELAESLALTIWNGSPDEELLRLAADGNLKESATFSRQVDRMLASPRGHSGLQQLLSEWLGVATFSGTDKNPALFPMFDDALKRSMAREVQRFVEHVLTERKGSLLDLLTLGESFPDQRLAAIYGLPAMMGEADRPVALPAGQRGGAFTLPAAIAAMSEASLTGIVYRGKVLLEKLLCIELSPPNMDVEFPDPETLGLPPNATTRERLETVETQAACSSCHRFLHPMSFAMETYDAIGRYRETENGRPIDASGRMAFTQTAAAPYQNAVEMFRVLAGSEDMHQCFVRQAFRYVHGRREEERDKPLLDSAYARFKGNGLDIRSLLRALVITEAFTHRERK